MSEQVDLTKRAARVLMNRRGWGSVETAAYLAKLSPEELQELAALDQTRERGVLDRLLDKIEDRLEPATPDAEQNASQSAPGGESPASPAPKRLRRNSLRRDDPNDE